MKKIVLMLMMGGIISTLMPEAVHTHVNINSMHGPFIQCTPNAPSIVEKCIHTSQGYWTIPLHKGFMSTYHYGIVILIIGGGIYLWLHRPLWFKK